MRAVSDLKSSDGLTVPQKKAMEINTIYIEDSANLIESNLHLADYKLVPATRSAKTGKTFPSSKNSLPGTLPTFTPTYVEQAVGNWNKENNS